jgi:hypothetical protein
MFRVGLWSRGREKAENTIERLRVWGGGAVKEGRGSRRGDRRVKDISLELGRV